MEYIGLFYAVMAAITWGLVYALDQKILGFTSPLTLLFIDSLLATLFTLPFVLLNPGPLKSILASGKSNIELVIVAIICAALANFLIFAGIKELGSASAAVIEITYPLFVVLFSYLIFRATPNLYFFAGALLIFLGSAMIIKWA
jgi:drug/metabolite transporter (DMT)-like permease